MTKYYKVNNAEDFDWLMKYLEETTDVSWLTGRQPTAHKVESVGMDFCKNVIFVSDYSVWVGRPPTDKIINLIHVSDLRLEYEQNKALQEFDPVGKPEHYNKGEIDLFESAYRTRPFNEFRAIMEFVAERYMKRDKDNRIQDLDKATYTIKRLKEYEELEEEE